VHRIEPLGRTEVTRVINRLPTTDVDIGQLKTADADTLHPFQVFVMPVLLTAPRVLCHQVRGQASSGGCAKSWRSPSELFSAKIPLEGAAVAITKAPMQATHRANRIEKPLLLYKCPVDSSARIAPERRSYHIRPPIGALQNRWIVLVDCSTKRPDLCRQVVTKLPSRQLTASPGMTTGRLPSQPH
jgi:hypothetical protein